jgi:hypothetical protein
VPHAMKTVTLALALTVFAAPNLWSQSGGRDLPLGLRSFAGVTLNRDSAASIRATLGTTRERRVLIGGERYVVLCYALSGDSSSAMLELMTNAGDATDVGASKHALNVIRLRAESPSEDRSGCARLHASTSLPIPGGLRLGSDVAAIEERLGSPTRIGADSLTYDFATKEYLAAGSPEFEIWNTPEYRESCFDAGLPYANVRARLTIVLREGRATEIRSERYDKSIC